MSMDRYEEPSNTRWRTFDEIRNLVQMMMNDRGPVLQQMRDILDRYDGDWIIPVPSVATEPVLPPLTPALIGEAIDSKARRASSVQPVVFCPALEPNKDRGKRSKEYAGVRRKVIAATYDKSRWKLGRRRFYRQLSAYETGSLCVVPDFDLMMPTIEVRDPLGTFVEPQAFEQLRDPEYVAFVTRHSGANLRRKYPTVKSEHGGPITAMEQHELWDVVEWYDYDQLRWGLIGPVRSTGSHIYDRSMTAPWMPLSPAFENRCGMLPCVVPHNVSLGRIASRIGTLLGNVDVQAKLMALDIIAQEKAIFPDMYAIGGANDTPRFIGQQGWQDGREGTINLLGGVEQIGMLRSTPDQRTQQIIDRLERNVRVSTGLSGNMSGENSSNLRTGRAIDTLAGMSIDPIVQELHEVSEAYIPTLNSAILAMWRAYPSFSGRRVLYSGWDTDRGSIMFDPVEHVEYDGEGKLFLHNTVKYAIPGADIVEATQVTGSMMGAGLIARSTARTMHPLISDPEQEGRLVDEELFEQAMKDSITQKLLSGEVAPIVAVKIRNHMQKGDDIFAAIEKVDKEMRELQATQAPPAPEGMIAPPEAMPGMAAGPEGMQQPMPEQFPMAEEVTTPVAQMRRLQQVMAG